MQATLPACFCGDEWQVPQLENPVACPLWWGLEPGSKTLTLVGWQERQSVVDPRCGLVPCVLGMMYCFCMESQRWHSWLQAELGVDSVDVSWPG